MRLCLAAIETPILASPWMPSAETNVFLSFFKRAQAYRVMKRLIDGMPAERPGWTTIDSGAHSFFAAMRMSVTRQISKKAVVDLSPQEYFRQYLDFLVKHHDVIAYFVELDLQELVGKEEVDRWRREIATAGLSRKCLYVHHSINTWAEYEKIVAECPSGYIALEGRRRGWPSLPYLKHIEYAYKNKTRVHGFAMNSQVVHETLPFFSIDSSSWMAVTRFGKASTFNEKTGRVEYVAVTRKALARPYLKSRMAAKLFPRRLRYDQPGIRESGAWALYKAESAWLALERHLTAMWAAKGVIWE